MTRYILVKLIFSAARGIDDTARMEVLDRFDSAEECAVSMVGRFEPAVDDKAIMYLCKRDGEIST